MFFPRIEYIDAVGATIVWLPSLPMTLWDPEEQGVGGWDETGNGTPIVWEQRQDYESRIVVRFAESEYPSASAWMRRAVNAGAVTYFRFQATDPATAFSLYVVKPRMGDRILYPRDPDYPRAKRLALTVRSTNGTRIHLVSA